MHFMKGGTFMNQEIIKAILLEQDETDILRSTLLPEHLPWSRVPNREQVF